MDTTQPDELVITLRKPVTIGSGEAAVTYTELKLREPTGAELVQWDDMSGAAADIRALSVVSGLPETAVRQIGVRDLRQGSAYLADFLSAAPRIGAS